MIRFSAFESHGLALAAMTEASDGDFSKPAPNAIPLNGGSLSALPIPAPITVTQVHGTHIAIVDARGAVSQDEADGIATECAAIPIAIRIADCVPLFLYEPKRRVCAVVHAGRQGTLRGIACAAIQRLTDTFRVDAGRIVAHIGPSAGPCCYQVNEEMAKEFSEKDLPTQGRFLDLWEANARQLARAGLPAAAITIEGRCTICDKSFHSYRRNGTSQRNLAVLMVGKLDENEK